MTWNELVISTPLAECVSSMLFDRGDVIAYVTSDSGYEVRLQIAGDTKIKYDDVIYKSPRQFPEELTKAIKFGKIQEGDDEVLNSNWYELAVYYNNEYLDGVVIDVPELLVHASESDLRNIMIDFYQDNDWTLD